MTEAVAVRPVEKPKVVAAKVGLTGNYAAAYAARDVDVDVVAAYPITPQTTIVEKLAEFVHNGELDAEFVTVESEHSAMSAVIGASAAGARVFTATAAQGLELMHETLHMASGLRLPVVMAVPGRALSAPISIHGDYQDVMNARDTGWIIFIASTAQEIYDTIIMAYRVAEDPRVLLPVMVAYDGFLMSHTTEPVELYDQKVVREFTPRRHRERMLLDPRHPVTMGVLATPDWYYEIKYQVLDALKRSIAVINEVQAEFEKTFGKHYSAVEGYMADDADYIVVTYGGAATWNAVEAAKEARGRGIKAGVVRLRLFRPFPSYELVKAVEDAKAVAVLDRALAPGAPLEGPVYYDVLSSLYINGIDKPLLSVVHGISQRTIYVRDVYELFQKLKEYAGARPKETVFMGLR